MIYLMDISLSHCAQPLQQVLSDQDFWMTAFGRFENLHALLPGASAVPLSANKQTLTDPIDERQLSAYSVEKLRLVMDR
jgi:hypothetical protein